MELADPTNDALPWVEGDQYVLLENAVADGSGAITITIVAIGQASGQWSNIAGLQITAPSESQAPEPSSESELATWGRWGHEVGHALGAGHPSNYNSDFDLMDANYPGQTGVFLKQPHQGYANWLPEAKYQVFTPAGGGGVASLWAMEFDPAGQPNKQAAKIKITDDFYYLVSVRRRVLGDELNSRFQPAPDGGNGIPDEGVLIERVVETDDQRVVLMGPGAANGVCDPGAGCDRQQLWKAGDYYDGSADGIHIWIDNKDDEDHYTIYVRYDNNANQPDVMLNPWTSPPANTWETTDIWIDSPINGYDTYRYGTWNDGDGNQVPRGNGDNPAIGQQNRLYARVRNRGNAPALDVEVEFQRTEPAGLGIAGDNGWLDLGAIDKNDFPGLANIPEGGFVDVYLPWSPDFDPSGEEIAENLFKFHTCVRVNLPQVAGETVLTNQDGDMEQENIDYFEVPAEGGAGMVYSDLVHLHNDDEDKSKYFQLTYKDDLPEDWYVEVNDGKMTVKLGPGEMRDIPVFIKTGNSGGVGEVFGVDIHAASLRTLRSDLTPKDIHQEYDTLGGVRIQAAKLDETKLDCSAEWSKDRRIYVQGQLLSGKYPLPTGKRGVPVFAQGVYSKSGKRHLLEGTEALFNVSDSGKFSGYLNAGNKLQPNEVTCLYAGTDKHLSASAGFVEVK